ncbi:MAG: Ig-like domain-containing protein, partial [Anaerolineaceae bacterium]|nr:Ig-like domain-containing protein [Anaerolineaceae bacterium]
MKKSPKHSIGIILSVILYLFLAVTSALAQTPEKSAGTPYQPIRKVDLGITSLTLEVGEKYTFSVSFDPKDSPVTRLTWFNTDNTVVAVNQLTNTVTVLTPGTARVMAESFDKEAYAVCEITVSGPQEKDLSGMVEGKALLTLSAEDREKIKASQINRYLDLLEMSVFNEETLQKLQNQTMDVMAEVRPGTEEAESERALALGMTRAYPMKHLHLVSLYGTFSQLLEFVKGNGNLIRIFKGHDTYIFDPRPESDASPLQTGDSQGTDTTMLQGHVEELTSVSTMHKLGYTGKGSTIAIVDTGLNSSHEQ